MKTLKVYVCTDHDCHYPVGVASVIVAANKSEAIKLLDEQLEERGLLKYEHYPYTLVRIRTDVQQAFVLQDGNY